MENDNVEENYDGPRFPWYNNRSYAKTKKLTAANLGLITMLMLMLMLLLMLILMLILVIMLLLMLKLVLMLVLS